MILSPKPLNPETLSPHIPYMPRVPEHNDDHHSSDMVKETIENIIERYHHRSSRDVTEGHHCGSSAGE